MTIGDSIDKSIGIDLKQDRNDYLFGSNALEFKDLGLDIKLVKALDKLGLSKCTKIQAKSIPIALTGIFFMLYCIINISHS